MDGNRPGAIGIGVGAALAPDRRLGLAVNTGRIRELQDRRPRSGCILGLSVLLTALMTCSRLYFFPEPSESPPLPGNGNQRNTIWNDSIFQEGDRESLGFMDSVTCLNSIKLVKIHQK